MEALSLSRGFLSPERADSRSYFAVLQKSIFAFGSSRNAMALGKGCAWHSGTVSAPSGFHHTHTLPTPRQFDPLAEAKPSSAVRKDSGMRENVSGHAPVDAPTGAILTSVKSAELLKCARAAQPLLIASVLLPLGANCAASSDFGLRSCARKRPRRSNDDNVSFRATTGAHNSVFECT